MKQGAACIYVFKFTPDIVEPVITTVRLGGGHHYLSVDVWMRDASRSDSTG